MQSTFLLCFAALLACVCARMTTPDVYKGRPLREQLSKVARHARDVSWSTNAGRGQVFGTLGSTDDSLFGRGGYKQDIFNDHRGHLQGQAYGSRVLGAYGDTTSLGGKLDWNNDNAKASLDVYKDIGRGSGFIMQPTFICLFALFVYVSAQVYLLPGYEKKDEEFYRRLNMALARGSMGRTWETNAGRGKVFGTLGSTDTSIFGQAGYKQDIFNDHRGHLEGEGYGSRVLGATGDSSVFGGKLNWSNDNARATVDVHKEVGGTSGMTVTGDGVWKLDKNTRLVAGGNLEKNFGHEKPVVGLEAKIEHDF